MAQSILHYFQGKRLIYIMGVFADKDYHTVLEKTAHFAEKIYTIATPDNPRALPAEDLAAAAKEYNENAEAADSIEDAVHKAFALAGYDEETLKSKFGALYQAFQFGAPPHAGMAPGVDRMLMLLRGEENIREVIAFPMSGSAQDLMCGAPNDVTEQQLREVHIKVRD